ncbi:MAG: Uma2 family endonuclease [Chloroherpetonaceae bacterium]
METTALETQQTLSQYELERGKPMPSKNHSKIEARLSFALISRYDEKYDVFSELSLELSSGKANPDLAIYPVMQDDWERDEPKMKTPPITTIEILSPTQPLNELVEKIRDVYFPAGVKSAWIILPPLKTVHIFYPDSPTETFTKGLITDKATGVELRLEDIFK